MLDIKYRPKKFSDVLGNEHVLRLLVRRSRNGTLRNRSMMFGGPKGCGKTTLARITARSIVCDNVVNGEPCGECDQCSSIMSDSSIVADEFDAATQGTVDRIRSIINDLEYGDIGGKPRVVILDEAHRLTKQSQDALLKPIEDRRFVLILCTTEPHKIVDTIRSRVEEYPVFSPTEDQIVSRMISICSNERIKADKEALRLICSRLNCCPRVCISCIDTLSSLGDITVESVKDHFRYGSYECVASVLSLVDSDPKAAFEKLDEVMRRESPSWIRDAMVSAISGALRQHVGVKSQYPVPTDFLRSRQMGWIDVARQLSSIEKPCMADIESTLLSGVKLSIPFTYTQEPPPVRVENDSRPKPVSSPIIQATASIPVLEVKTSPTPDFSSSNYTFVQRTLEIDGVKFTPEEHLTSLDRRIEHGSRGIPMSDKFPSAEVELNSAKAPLPEKEFVRGILARFKKENTS